MVFSAPDLQLLCSLPSGLILGEEGTMRVQLAQQAQDLLGKSDLVIITERVDDVALLIGQMVKMGEVYAWPQDLMRCDATPIAGAHEVAAGGLLQCGQRKEEPTRPQ